jgi:hypothetical protein
MQINRKIEFDNHETTDELKVLALIAVLFGPVSHVTAVFNMQGLPFTLNGLTLSTAAFVAVCTYVAAYLLLRKWAETVRLARALRGRLGLSLDVAVSQAQTAILALIQALRRAKVYELPGPQPQSPTSSAAKPQPHNTVLRRASTWISILSFKRKASKHQEHSTAV